MNKYIRLSLSAIVFTTIFCIGVVVAEPGNGNDVDPEINTLTNYPRIEHFEQGSVQVDFPSLESWPEFHYLKAWLPVEVSLQGDSQPRVGSVYMQAMTDIDFEQRTVSISELKVLKTKFTEVSQTETVTALINRTFQGRESIVPLDILLRLLPDDFEVPDQGKVVSRLNFEAPAILVAETPIKLLSIDKEPVRAEIEGTELEYVVNTNWHVFYYRPDAEWYVLNGDAWQQSNYLSDGDWKTIDELPADFDRLALDDHWQEVQKSLPASIPTELPTAFVISLQETELIQLEGEPQLTAISETGISFVSNTKSDLFNLNGRWYFLVSGRWFENKGLDGHWKPVDKLPEAFSGIPPDHAKGHVLFSVPGTRQAKLALIEAALPHRVSVAANAGSELQVTWIGEPRFENINTTGLQRGLNTPFQVIKHNNFFYLCHDGVWYFSDSPNGAWKVAVQIPDEIYRIPATDPAYNVTFVRPESDQQQGSEQVNFEYTGGYKGNFSSRVSVVYGTGWNYPSSVYWDSTNRPAYWQYGRTYGYNVGYHPVGAYYGGRSRYHYPSGGFGRGPYGYGGWGGYYGTRTTINITSPSVNYTQGQGSAWEGPFQTTPGNPANSAENSLDKFLPKKKIDGTEKFEKVSKADASQPAKVSASSLYASSTLSTNRFSGPNGEVYKREGQEWSQYKEGNWDTMNAIQQNQAQEARPRQKAETQNQNRWLPAHKRTLSRSELDRQELARLEGMDNYSKYRMQKLK